MGQKKPQQSRVCLAVHAPAMTKEVMMALRDWEPLEGLKFTLVRRSSYTLIFEVSTASGYQARGLALKRLGEKSLADIPHLDISVV